MKDEYRLQEREMIKMVNKLGILAGAIIFIITLSIFASGLTITNYLDGTSRGNFTYTTGGEWYTKALGIPNGASINNAYLYLNGYSNLALILKENGINVSSYSGLWETTGTPIVTNPEMSDDGDNSSYSSTSGGVGGSASFYLNFTNNNIVDAKIESKMSSENSNYRVAYCQNTSNGVWIVMESDMYLGVPYGASWRNYTVNSTCISNLNSTINTLFYFNRTGTTLIISLYEIRMIANRTVFPTNTSVILNNQTTVFNYGALNSSDLNHSVLANITSYLSGLSGYPQNISFRSNTSGILEYSDLYVSYLIYSNISFYFELNKTIPYRATNITLTITEGNGSVHQYWSNNGSILFTNMQSHGIATVEYFDDSYPTVTRRFYFDNLEETAQNISLYVINSSNVTQVLFTLYQETDLVQPGYYIGVWRKHYPDTSFYEVEMHKTDENGQAIMNLELYDQIYYFTIYDQNLNLVYTSNPTEIKSTSMSLTVQTGEDVWRSLTNIQGVDVAQITYDPATQQFSTMYNDTVGILNYTRFTTKLRTYFGDITICDNISYTSQASLYCTISDYNRSGMYVSQLWFETATTGSRYLGSSVTYTPQTTSEKMGLTGVFITLIIVIALVFLGLYNPAVAVIMAILGLIVSFFLKMFVISIGTLVVIIIIGAIIIKKMRT